MNDGTTTSFTYGYNRGTNQLASAAQTGGSTLGYSYDAAGNLTARTLGKTTQLALSYNADGRPATAGPESYKYDGFGERALINATTTSHDIFGLGGELLAENTASGVPLRSYVYLNGLPLALVDSAGNIAYILADQVGQPQKMVDGTGALTWDRVADIFGATVAQPAGMTAANPLRFPGQQFDAATGLHYNHFRDYDPALGRYVQSDPIGLAGGINTYAFVGGNPLRFGDPSGEGPLGAVVGAIIGALLEGATTEGLGAIPGAILGAHLGDKLEDAYLAARRAAAARSAAEEAALTGTALARSLGQAGECAVGTTAPKAGIQIPGSGITRFPDQLTSTTLTEVKNVQYLSYTQQLRDYAAYAQQNGLQFNLYVRPDTTLSGPLQDAVNSGQIHLFFIPPP